MRCFIGLPLPEEYQQELRTVVATWKPRLRSRLSWTKPGNWHMTLKFLGEVSEVSLEHVIQSLAEPLGAGFVLRAGGGGFFPNQAKPRVLWVGVRQGGEDCRGLAGEVQRRLAVLGHSAEGRAFAPHLTVARIKEARPDPWPDLLRELHVRVWPEARMDRVVLWESRLDPDGPIYRQVAAFRLDEPTGRCPSD